MSTTSSPSMCARCAQALPSDARFCPHCGQPVNEDQTAPLPLTAAPDSPPRVHRVERRPLGLAPTPLIGAIGLLAVVGGTVLLAAGTLATGVVLLLLGAALLLLFVVAARQEPDSPAARALSRAAARVRDRTGYAVAASRTWSSTSGEVARLTWRRRALERELDDLMAPLGRAVHLKDELRAQALKARATQLRRSIEDLEARKTALVHAAHDEVQKERVPVQATQVLPSVPPPPGTSTPTEDEKPDRVSA